MQQSLASAAYNKHTGGAIHVCGRRLPMAAPSQSLSRMHVPVSCTAAKDTRQQESLMAQWHSCKRLRGEQRYEMVPTCNYTS